jgi:hypothetical protein
MYINMSITAYSFTLRRREGKNNEINKTPFKLDLAVS